MSGSDAPLDGLGAGSPRRGLALMLVVFVLGIVCGAALAVIVIRSVIPPRPGPRFAGGPPRAEQRFERMAERLDLNDGQRVQVRAELDATRQSMDRLLRESAERIRAVLDEDQRRRFDEMRPREGSRRRRFEGREGPPPSGGPPPDP